MKIVTISENDAGQRLDKFLSKAFHSMPKSMMYKFIRTKKIKVNRKRAEIGQMLNANDTVELFVKEEFLSSEPQRELFKNIKPAFKTVYEDENLIICDKPVGMLSHSDTDGEQNTLVEQIKAYLWLKGEYVPENEMSFAPALCNRIDRNTGGLVVAAKNAQTLRVMNEKIKKRTISKYYLCMVHGIMEKKSAVLEGYLTKDSDENMVTIYKNPPRGDAKKIITKYRVLKENGGNSTLEVELVTGRTHQIRAHMASIGHPLIGDGKYAENKEDRKAGFSRQALYSYKITFEKDEPSHLDYLTGKTFTADISGIGFLQ